MPYSPLAASVDVSAAVPCRTGPAPLGELLHTQHAFLRAQIHNMNVPSALRKVIRSIVSFISLCFTTKFIEIYACIVRKVDSFFYLFALCYKKSIEIYAGNIRQGVSAMMPRRRNGMATPL